MVEFSVRRHCLTPYHLQKLRQTVNYFRKKRLSMLWKVGNLGTIDVLDILDALGNLEYLGNYALCITHYALFIMHCQKRRSSLVL